MNIRIITIIGLVFCLSTGCSKDKNSETGTQDYLVFGHFYGMCVGETCVETFKLTDNSLYEDTIDDYTGQSLYFVKLDPTKFSEVKDLVNYIPEELLNESRSILGCPDCADGGGLYIKYVSNGVIKTWRIDQVKRNVPAYLHGFMDKVNEKIALINK